ncbi:MAG: hypothetical protein JWP03_3344 [Phycisphaerales bacterium]|nr:hypothetical protein [Phycisphaerales bacterium]
MLSHRIGIRAALTIILVCSSALCAQQAPPRDPLPTPPPEVTPARAGAFPAPAPAKDAALLGMGVQRTMTLLATSTPEHRNHVRVLFYGQSITEQEWSKQVAEDLRRRFPNADLEIENRAIGGFASQLLIRPAEHDLYPFYPDLLIFHVYGANQEYEQIIKSARSRTACEVLMQTDHVTKWPPAVIDEKQDKGMWWDDLMNHHLLPDIAKKYGCGLCDNRSAWLDYLKDNHLEPAALLKDGVHLNAHGNYLMAQLVSRYLVYRPELAAKEPSDLAHVYAPGKEANWKDGVLEIEFEGNRVDVLPAPGARPGVKASVLIDGKSPATFGGAYRITRPQPGPWSPLFLSRVDHAAALQIEDWTLNLKNVSPDGKKWDFDLTGSKTGPDGSGSSDKPFTSTSGRVKIEPAAWFRGFNPPLPNGYEIKWQVLPMFVETYETPKDADVSRENATTVVQGIVNTKHTLRLTAADPTALPAIAAVRTYKPPVKAE